MGYIVVSGQPSYQQNFFGPWEDRKQAEKFVKELRLAYKEGGTLDLFCAVIREIYKDE